MAQILIVLLTLMFFLTLALKARPFVIEVLN